MKENKGPYGPIKLFFLQHLDGKLLEFSIFLKLSEDKYVPLHKANEVLDFHEIYKFREKGIVNVYILESDFNQFSEIIFSNSTDSSSQIASNEMLQELIASIGINQVTLDITEKLTANIVKNAKNVSPETLFLKKQLLNQSNSFVRNHSYLTSVIASAIGAELGWASDEIMEKMVTAALLHDSCIEDDTLIFQHDINPDRVENYPKAQEEVIKNHSTKLCEILSKLDRLDQDSEQILLQHHEKVDGSGWPRGLTSEQVRPASAVFIISHFFICELYRIGFQERLFKDAAVGTYKIHNKKGPFLRASKAFKQAIIDKIED